MLRFLDNILLNNREIAITQDRQHQRNGITAAFYWKAFGTSYRLATGCLLPISHN